MSVLWCQCLNVSVHVASQLPSDEQNNNTDTPPLPPPLLRNSHIVRARSHDLRVLHTWLHECGACGTWRVHKCLNCATTTHAVLDSGGRDDSEDDRTAAGQYSLVAINNQLTDSGSVSTVRANVDFSEWLGILMRRGNCVPTTSLPPLPSHALQCVGDASQRSLSTVISELNNSLEDYLRQQERVVETDVARYQQLKMHELSELKRRASHHLQLMTRKLMSIDGASSDSVNNSRLLPSARLEAQAASVNNSSATSQRQRRHTAEDMGVFVMDDEDMSACQLASQLSGAVAGGGDVTDNARDDDVSSVGSDSGVEGGVAVPPPSSTSARQTTGIGRSLPVHIPSRPVAVGRRGWRNERGVSDAACENSDDETLPDIEQMGASIRQISLQMYANDEHAFDLPRSRTQTIHSHQRYV